MQLAHHVVAVLDEPQPRHLPARQVPPGVALRPPREQPLHGLAVLLCLDAPPQLEPGLVPGEGEMRCELYDEPSAVCCSRDTERERPLCGACGCTLSASASRSPGQARGPALRLCYVRRNSIQLTGPIYEKLLLPICRRYYIWICPHGTPWRLRLCPVRRVSACALCLWCGAPRHIDIYAIRLRGFR